MTSLYNKAIELQNAFNDLNATAPKDYLEKLIRAYDQKVFDEFLGYFAEDKSLNEDAMRAFLNETLNRSDSTLVSIYTRPESLITTLLFAIADEFDKDGKIIPLTVTEEEGAKLGFPSELVEWLGASAAIKNKQESTLFVCLPDEDILMLIEANAHIGASLIKLYGANNLVTLLLNSDRDLEAISDVLECLMTQNLNVFLKEETSSVFNVLAKDKAMLLAGIYLKTLNDTEQVLGVFSELSIEQRKDIYVAQSDQFYKLIKDACDLKDILQFFPEDLHQSVLEQIIYKVPLFIDSLSNLMVVLQLLQDEHTKWVLNEVKDYLPQMIFNNSDYNSDFDDVIQVITDSQRLLFIDSLVNTFDDCFSVFKCAREDTYDLIIKSVEYKLPNLITNASQLGDILEFLDKKQCDLVIKSCYERLITNSNQLLAVLELQNKSHRGLIINSVKRLLPKLIPNVDLLINVLQLLNETDRKTVVNSVSKQVLDFNFYENYLVDLSSKWDKPEPELESEINSVSKLLPDLISNADQLVAVLKLLDKPEIEALIYSVSRQQWIDLITNANQLASVLRRLAQGSEERGFVIRIVKDILPGLFADVNQLASVLYLLAEHPEERELVLESVQEHLPNLLTDANQLASVLRRLAEDSGERGFVIRTVKDMLPCLFADANQLASVLHLLAEDPEERELVLESVQESLPNWLTDADKLVAVLECLAEGSDERGLVISTVKDMLPGLFADANQLAFVLDLLAEAPEARELVLESVQESLPKWLTDADKLVAVFECLADDSEERGFVIRAVKEMLPGLFTDANQLATVLELLIKDVEARELVLEAVQKNLPNLLTNGAELVAFLKPLTHCECGLVIAAVREQLPHLITDAKQLILVIDVVNDSQAVEILPLVVNPSWFSEQLLAKEQDDYEDKAEQHVFEMLNQLGKKSLELVRDDEIDKAFFALSLYNNVNQLFECYQQSPKNPSDFDAFYKKSAELIDTAKDGELKHHRGWKELFINLLIGIASLGLAFAVNKIVTGGRCSFFSVNTDSLNKVDELSDALHALAPTQANITAITNS